MPKGTINGEPYLVPEGYRVVSEAGVTAGIRARQLLSDLDRSPNGRHEGDMEFQDPTGRSQGNPLLKTGQVIGYGMDGGPITVPEPRRRGDPDAWTS